MSTLALDRPVYKTVLLDALLCVTVFAIPALSHAAAYPLYRFDPMRVLVFAAILFSSRRNALLMALWLPLLSMLTSGHPVFPKVVLIQGELALNVLVFYGLVRRSGGFAFSATVSILSSKAVYYLAKYLMIEAALMEGHLISTPWAYQFAVLVLIVLVSHLILLRRSPYFDR